MCPDCERLMKRIEELEEDGKLNSDGLNRAISKLAKAEKALSEYGRCLNFCDTEEGQECSCGYEDALEGFDKENNLMKPTNDGREG